MQVMEPSIDRPWTRGPSGPDIRSPGAESGRLGSAELLLLLGDVEAGGGAFQGDGGALEVGVGVAAAQALFGALLGLLRPGHVDVLGALGDLGENRGLVGQDLGESPRHRDLVALPVGLVGNLADPKLGNQRRVAGEHAGPERGQVDVLLLAPAAEVDEEADRWRIRPCHRLDSGLSSVSCALLTLTLLRSSL